MFKVNTKRQAKHQLRHYTFFTVNFEQILQGNLVFLLLILNIHLHPSFVKFSQVGNLIKCNCWNLRKTSMKSLKQAREEIQVTNPTRWCSIEKLFLNILQHSQENTCVGVSLLIIGLANLIKKSLKHRC